MRTPRSGISGRATSICLGIGARHDRTDDVTIAMKPQPEPSAQEVLAGLVERVTYHNAENGFCVLRAKARGHRDVVTVVGHAAVATRADIARRIQLGRRGPMVISSRATQCIVKKNFEAAAAANGHLIVQLKDNQPTLCQKVEASFKTALSLSGVRTVDEKKRNRHETESLPYLMLPAVAGTEWEPHV